MPTWNFSTTTIVCGGTISNRIKATTSKDIIVYAKCIKLGDFLDFNTGLIKSKEMPGMSFTGKASILDDIPYDSRSICNILLIDHRDGTFLLSIERVGDLEEISPGMMTNLNNMIDHLCNTLMKTNHPVTQVQDPVKKSRVKKIEVETREIPVNPAPIPVATHELPVSFEEMARIKPKECIDF